MGDFPALGFWLLGWGVVSRTLLGWRARGVGLVLLSQLFLAPLVGPTVGTWLGLRGPAPTSATEDLEGELAQIERRHDTLAQVRTLAEKVVTDARKAHELGDLPDDAYQRKVDRLMDQRRSFDAQDEKMRQRVDQLRHAIEDRQRANEQRARSRLCVARTCEGLLILSLSLGLAIALTITCGVRNEALLPDAEPALDQLV